MDEKQPLTPEEVATKVEKTTETASKVLESQLKKRVDYVT